MHHSRISPRHYQISKAPREKGGLCLFKLVKNAVGAFVEIVFGTNFLRAEHNSPLNVIGQRAEKVFGFGACLKERVQRILLHSTSSFHIFI